MARRDRVTVRDVIAEARSKRDEIENAILGILSDADDELGIAEWAEDAINHPRFLGFFVLRFSLYAVTQRQRDTQKALGDGTLLQMIIDFINNGGLEIIAQFIATLVSIFGGLGARAEVLSSSTPGIVQPAGGPGNIPS